MPDISLRIGGCYLRGEGVPADPDMALRLLEQAKCGFRERLDDGDRFASGSLKRAEEAWAEAYKALNGSEA